MIRLIAFFILFAFPVYAAGPIIIGGGSSDSSFDCTGYDVCQNFENASGYDNSETWTENDGTTPVDPDYSSSPITGTYSLRLADGGTDSDTYTTFSAHGDGTTTYVYFRFKVLTDVGADGDLATLTDGGLFCGRIKLDTAGVLKLVHGGETDDGTTDVSGGGIFHVWFDWTTNSGATDGSMNLYVVADAGGVGTKPGSPEATISVGTANYPGVDRIQLKAEEGLDIIIDRVLVDNSVIGSQ